MLMYRFRPSNATSIRSQFVMISESDLVIKELSLLHMEIKEHDIFFFEMGIKELHF